MLALNKINKLKIGALKRATTMHILSNCHTQFIGIPEKLNVAGYQKGDRSDTKQIFRKGCIDLRTNRQILLDQEEYKIKSSSRKKNDSRYVGLQTSFKDAFTLLSSSMVLQPFDVRVQQTAAEHQSVNKPTNTYYNKRRFEYEHTERNTVDFVCPVQCKHRTKEVKNDLHSKLDCASLKQAGALDAVISDKQKGYGCKHMKKPLANQKPNACGVIFECSKKEVDESKKNDSVF